MKCPKCSYLGFETGDRCKNCGYDFSLSMETAAPRTDRSDADLPLRGPDSFAPGSNEWDDLNRATERTALPESLSNPLASIPLDTIVALPTATVAARAAKPVDEARATARTAVPSLPLFQPGADQDEPLIRLPAAPR